MHFHILKFVIFLKFLIKSFDIKITIDKQFTIYLYNTKLLYEFSWFFKNLLINFDKIVDMHMFEILNTFYVYLILFSFKDNYNLISFNALKNKNNFLNTTILSKYNICKTNSFITKYFATNWLEREIWDMYGFKFNNHLNLKRILSDYGFTQHPLKKSFPVIGFFQLDFSTYQGLIIYNNI